MKGDVRPEQDGFMDKTVTRFTFGPDVSMAEVEGTLRLSRLATESLHGFARVQLEASCSIDHRERRVEIEASTDVGHTLALIFLGYVRREFGSQAVRVVPGRTATAMAGMETA
jgi:hypothetical protein